MTVDSLPLQGPASGAAGLLRLMRQEGAGVNTPPRLLTVADIAAALRVSKMTIYRMIDSGQLPASKFGRSLRVTEHAFRDYLERSPLHDGDPKDILDSLLPPADEGPHRPR